MKPGRNDPCPCGSGKKYKSCCLAAEQRAGDSPNDLVWARVRRATAGMPKTLGRFVAEVYGPAAFEEGWDEFLLWEGGEFDPESPLMAIFMPWLYHCWMPDPFDDTAVEDESVRELAPTSAFLERRAERLDPLLRRYLAACLETPFSFHEILRCDRGRGFRTRDVITGEEHEVLERAASESMQAGDILFGQLVPIEGIVLLEACSPYALSPIDKIPIIELREDFADEALVDPEIGDWRDAWQIEIRELYLRLIASSLNPRPPVLHNTDGELVNLQRVVFDVDDAERAFAALARAGDGVDDAEVERAADGRLERARFSWGKAGNRLHPSWENTILGAVEITGTRLVAHVNSDERARLFHEIVEQALGGAAHYRGSEAIEHDELDVERALADDERENANAAPNLNDDPQVREHLSRMFEQHYEDWVTQEIPALGGERPIDALQSATGREKVEALITDMERRAARQGPGPSAAALARLRERLGLARG